MNFVVEKYFFTVTEKFKTLPLDLYNKMNTVQTFKTYFYNTYNNSIMSHSQHCPN